jgi:glutamate racemase
MIRSKLANKPAGKIGVFDSGLGGLIILKSIRAQLPQYDYEYFGDTKNLPYGDKTQREIFDFTVKGINYLQGRGCTLIIIACNTASAKALRRIQRQWLPKHAPDLKVLGVLVPTLEFLKANNFPAILLATESTIKSKAYETELTKVFPKQSLIGIAAPDLVPLIEQGETTKALMETIRLVRTLQMHCKSLILGCTHYPLLSSGLHKAFPKLKLIDQTKIIPKALKVYLNNHPEIKNGLAITARPHYILQKLRLPIKNWLEHGSSQSRRRPIVIWSYAP